MKIKKLLSMLLIAALCLGAIPAGVFAQEESLPQEAAAEAEAQPEEAALADSDGQKLPEGQFLTEDGFQYRINEAGEVTITQYKGDAADLVVPATIDGKRVSGLGYNTCVNNPNLKSLKIEEGVGSIGEGAFYNCANLSKIELPSTIVSYGSTAFDNCALTDTDGFSKLKNLREHTQLSLANNKITDLSGLKELPLYGLNLSNNANLTDITPLIGMNSLNSLTITGTAVSEESLWPLYRFDTLESSIFDIGTMREIGPKPNVYTDRNNALRDKITYTIADTSVANFENNNSLKINKVGETNATATYKNESKNFKIVVRDMEHAPDAGAPIENLPTLELHKTPDGIVNLNLKDNGELWNISADEPEMIKNDVKNITTSQIPNKQYSWLFIQDQEDSLWVQETKAGQVSILTKKLENVAKYVGNNAYDINRNVKAWAWVMHKEGGLSHIKTDGTVEAIPSAGIKDIANLQVWSDSICGVTVLKEDGTIWVKLDPRIGQSETQLVQLAENAVALSGEKGFIDIDGNYHEISLDWQSDTGTYKAMEKLVADGAVAVFSVRSGSFSDFFVDKNGATWAKSFGPDEKTEKIGDMTLAYAPVYQSVYVNNPDTGLSGYSYVYYFQDTSKNLWKYVPLTKETIKVDENVEKTAILAYGMADNNHKYLKTDGTYVDGDTKTSGVADFMGDYLFMKDGQVRYRGQSILNGVIGITSSTTAYNPATNNVTYADDCYMTRTDGSVWLHSTRNPSVLTKVANYPEMAPVAVTGVTVAPATLEMTMGEAAKQLTATIMPADAGNKAVKWSSSDEKIAKVDENGMVTAVGAGKATITATTLDGGFTASCAVSVNKPIVHVTGVALDKTAIGPMTIGYYETLTATVSPADADNKAVTWATDNAAVATVEQSGRITSVGAGSATITATTADGGFKASCAVTVAAPKPEAVTDPVVPDEPTQPVEVSNTEITITVPTETIASIPELEGAKLTVRSVNNSSSAEDQAVTQKAEQEVKEVIASNADIASADVLEILDFIFVDPETGEEVPFDGTQTNVSVRLTLKITPAQKDHYDFFQVYVLNDDGTLGEKVADYLTADSENNISADAKHFSKYILVGVNEETAPAPGGDPEEGEIPEPGKNEPIGTEVTISQPGSNAGTGIITDTHTSAYLCAGMLILSAAGLMAFRKRRNAR